MGFKFKQTAGEKSGNVGMKVRTQEAGHWICIIDGMFWPFQLCLYISTSWLPGGRASDSSHTLAYNDAS